MFLNTNRQKHNKIDLSKKKSSEFIDYVIVFGRKTIVFFHLPTFDMNISCNHFLSQFIANVCGVGISTGTTTAFFRWFHCYWFIKKFLSFPVHISILTYYFVVHFAYNLFRLWEIGPKRQSWQQSIKFSVVVLLWANWKKW